MFAEIDWSNLQIASAFVLGAVLGSLATIRVMRAVLQTFERRPRRRHNGNGNGDDDSF